jgi:hypothetical protein
LPFVIERPKYLEYRHQRDRIASFQVQRSVEVKVERPAAALLRLVGKKTSAKTESFLEEWTVELRTTDVMPDRSALVKTQVTRASRSSKSGEPMEYGERESPTTEFLNEVVDLYGMLSGHHGSLPTPHLAIFSEEPVKQGQEWQRTRHELLPISSPDGSIRAFEAKPVTYTCRLEGLGEENGIEYADISISGTGEFGEGEGVRQSYTVSGRVRFALREGHTLTAEVARAMASVIGETVLTRSASEKFAFMSRGTEQTVGGMRI